MEYQIIQIDHNSWRIEDSGVRFFVLTGQDRALLIDSGRNVHTARDIAATLTNLPIMLLNTHADGDHVGSNAQFESFYMHPADEDQYRQDGKTGRVIPVADGDEIDLGGRVLKIIHLPGHTPGSIAVLDVNHRVLISGDPIQGHGHIFMFGRNRNMNDYIASLEALEKRTDEFDEIWPSHGDLPVYPVCIPKLREAAEKIVNGEAKGKETDFFGQMIIVYDLGFTVFLCAQ